MAACLLTWYEDAVVDRTKESLRDILHKTDTINEYAGQLLNRDLPINKKGFFIEDVDVKTRQGDEVADFDWRCEQLAQDLDSVIAMRSYISSDGPQSIYAEYVQPNPTATATRFHTRSETDLLGDEGTNAVDGVLTHLGLWFRFLRSAYPSGDDRLMESGSARERLSWTEVDEYLGLHYGFLRSAHPRAADRIMELGSERARLFRNESDAFEDMIGADFILACGSLTFVFVVLRTFLKSCFLAFPRHGHDSLETHRHCSSCRSSVCRDACSWLSAPSPTFCHHGFEPPSDLESFPDSNTSSVA